MICPRDGDNGPKDNCPDTLREQLAESFRDPLVSANGKSDPEELTNDEKCALCFFSGVPFRVDPETNQLEFRYRIRFERNETKNAWIINCLVEGGKE